MSEMPKITPLYTTVLFDMDGTLLDLAFDNYIWLQQVPEIWAKQQQVSLDQAKAELYEFYLKHQGSLNWYSSQFWQNKLDIDVLSLQYQHQTRIAARSGCFELLQQLKAHNIACWLVTNADENTLQLKLNNIPIQQYFDVIVSSETLGYPKEHQGFRQALQMQQSFDPEQCLLLDDNYDVLASAERYGIAKVVSIEQPDSSHARRSFHPDYLHLAQLSDLLALIFKQSTPIDSPCLA